MRISLLLMIVSGMTLSANALSQHRVSLDVSQVSVMELFREIQKKTDLFFVYNAGDLQQFDRVSVSAESEEVASVLRRVFGDEVVEFVFEDNVIVVKPREQPALSRQQQRVVVTGRVSGPDGRPIPGVSVIVRDTGNGAITDINGHYTVGFAPSPNVFIDFSFMGMVPQEYAYTGQNQIDVTLVEQNTVVDEIQVVGYGTMRKRDFTGSVSSVKQEELQNIPFMSIDDALAGKASGVSIIKADGSPGGAVRVRVRGGTSLIGMNDPLYVIDGIPVMVTDNYLAGNSDIVNNIEGSSYGENARTTSISGSFERGLNNLTGLNINDIETIDILKDASATAIYGSKAANGVVLITTKKGRKGSAPQVQANYYAGFSFPITEDVLNRDQYVEMLQEAAQNFISARDKAGLAPNNSYRQAESILSDPESILGSADTDWLDMVTQTAFTHNGDVSVSGGGEHSTYYVSLAYSGQKGTIKNTDFKRVSGKINLESDISKYVKIFTNLNYGFTRSNITDGAYGQALMAPPTMSPYHPDGSYVETGEWGPAYHGFQNPAGLLEVTNLGKNYSFMGTIGLDVLFLKNFRFRSTASINYGAYNQTNYIPSFVFVGGFYGKELSGGGQGTEAHSTSINAIFENTVSWNRVINDIHRFDVVAGTSWEEYRKDFLSASGTGYPDDYELNNLSSAIIASKIAGANPTAQNSLLSFYGRANYVLEDRYLFTFTARADASSKFAPDHRYGFFPSGAVAWRLSEERFMDRAYWVNEIKLRVSHGKTGTQNINDHMYLTLYEPQSYAGANALVPSQLGNNSIRWESTVQTDIALDFSFLNNRIGGTVCWYQKVADNVLLNMTLAPSSSFDNAVFNIAKIRNRGLEIDLFADIIRTQNFRWNITANIARNRSKVMNLYGDTFSDPNNRNNLNLGTSVLQEGQPLGLLWGRLTTGNGIITTQQQLEADLAYLESINMKDFILSYFMPYMDVGDVRYKWTADGIWEYGIIGRTEPKFFGGFTNTFNYKNLTLVATFTYSYGNDMLYQKDVTDMAMNSLSNRNVRVMERWTSANPSTSRPRSMYSSTNMLTNLNVYDASFLKLKSVTVSYQVPKSFCQKLKIRGASVYASATNLFTITSYPGPDPEVSDKPGSIIGGGRDLTTYPTSRSVTMGLRLNF